MIDIIEVFLSQKNLSEVILATMISRNSFLTFSLSFIKSSESRTCEILRLLNDDFDFIVCIARLKSLMNIMNPHEF